MLSLSGGSFMSLCALPLPKNAVYLSLFYSLVSFNPNIQFQFSWYSRRVAVAGIYKMTELYMLQDKSANFEETWHFLGRRIEDVSQLHNYLHQSGELSQVAKDGVTAAFITVC
jgi:ubiquinone biosynthesis protein COQ9